MVVVIILGLLAMLLGYNSKPNNKALLWAFVFIFAFLALRYNYGNDYKSYNEGFTRINSYAIDDISKFDFDGDRWEFGWVAANLLCKPIGFVGLVVLWSLFYCIVYYFFIKKYVIPKYYWLALFFLIFMPPALLIGLSMLRNMMAILIFMIAFNFLIKRGWRNSLIYLLLIYLATLFHKSANVLFILVILPYINVEIRKRGGIILLVIYGLLFSYASIFTESITTFIAQSDMFSSYSWYIEKLDVKNTTSFGVGFLINLLLMILVLLTNSDEKDEANKLAIKLFYIGNLITPIGILIPMLGRFSYYFVPFIIICYANMFSKIKNSTIRMLLIFFIIAFTAYQFFIFFYDDIWIDSFMTYKTIFSIN